MLAISPCLSGLERAPTAKLSPDAAFLGIARSDMHLRFAGLDAGSTQEEVGALVQANLAEANTTGTNRPVSWDGQTNKGPGLQNQIRAINDQRVRRPAALPNSWQPCTSFEAASEALLQMWARYTLPCTLRRRRLALACQSSVYSTAGTHSRRDRW